MPSSDRKPLFVRHDLSRAGLPVLSVSVLTFRPPTSNRLPTGLGKATPVAVHPPTTVIMSSGSDRIRTV